MDDRAVITIDANQYRSTDLEEKRRLRHEMLKMLDGCTNIAIHIHGHKNPHEEQEILTWAYRGI